MGDGFLWRAVVGRFHDFSGLTITVVAWLDAHSGAVQAAIGIIVAIFTGQLVSTSRRQWTAARDAAVAAKLSADAAVRLELPVLRIAIPDLITVDQRPAKRGPWVGNVNDGPPQSLSSVPAISVSNGGRSTSFLEAISLGWVAGPKLPSAPAYTYNDRIGSEGMVPAGGKVSIDVEQFVIELSEEQIALVTSEEISLWVFGELKYRDFLDQTSTKRFCFRHWCPDGEGLHYFAYENHAPDTFLVSAGAARLDVDKRGKASGRLSRGS